MISTRGPGRLPHKAGDGGAAATVSAGNRPVMFGHSRGRKPTIDDACRRHACRASQLPTMRLPPEARPLAPCSLMKENTTSSLHDDFRCTVTVNLRTARLVT